MSAGSGKAAKFVAANPLAPMADPFAGMDNDQREYQQALAENVNKRLEKAMGELKEKHQNGTNEIDDEDRAPTGDPYQRHKAEMERRKREHDRVMQRQREEEAKELKYRKEQAEHLSKFDENDDSDSDSGDELLIEYDDPDIERIRAERLQALKAKQMEMVQNKAKGHGQYRMIYQDDFLPECTGSKFVAVHFFHKEFERCKIMDHHLGLIAPAFLTCKFVRIDAEKAPFFVSKLQVKTLPTLIVFEDGKAINRLTGFEGLAKNPNEPDKWHTGKLQEWLAQTGAIQYRPPTEEVLEEMRRLGIKQHGSIWSSSLSENAEDDEY